MLSVIVAGLKLWVTPLGKAVETVGLHVVPGFPVQVMFTAKVADPGVPYVTVPTCAPTVLACATNDWVLNNRNRHSKYALRRHWDAKGALTASP